MLKQQNNACAICLRPATDFKQGLHTEHCHKWRKIKVVTTKDKLWKARATYWGKVFESFSSKRNEAIRMVKASLQTSSVRGLCCYRCNRGLAWYRDDPKRLKRASEYLEKHQGAK